MTSDSENRITVLEVLTAAMFLWESDPRSNDNKPALEGYFADALVLCENARANLRAEAAKKK